MSRGLSLTGSRYCHNNYVRQFHQAPGGKPGPNGYEPKEDTTYEAYNLGFSRGKKHGREDGEMPTTTFGIGPWSRYLVQRWTDGTRCAETRKPREVEVQVHCSLSSHDSIFMIKEVSLCQYVLVIYTPSLCSLPGFRPQSALDVEPAGIRCREMMEDDDFEQWNVERIERERLEHEGKLLEGAKIGEEQEQRAKKDAEARIKANEDAEKDGTGSKKGKGAKHGNGQGSGSDSEKVDRKSGRGGLFFTEDDLDSFTASDGELDETAKMMIVNALRTAFGMNGDGEEIPFSFLDLLGGNAENEEVAAAGLGLPVISLENLANAAKAQAVTDRKDNRQKPQVQIENREAGNLGVRTNEEDETTKKEPESRDDKSGSDEDDPIREHSPEIPPRDEL